MAKLTRKEIRSHKAFLRRQKVHEKKYQRQFYNWLKKTNDAVADAIENIGNISTHTDLINYDTLNAIYKRLYNDVGISEARIQSAEFEQQQKAEIPISLWRRLLGDFVTVTIAQRITEVLETTRKRIAHIIEKSIDDGLGYRETAKLIREDMGYNKNRSVAIARTETITAANKGKLIAAQNSEFEKRKSWIPTLDKRTRHSHRMMENSPFIDLDQDFELVDEDGTVEHGLHPGADTFSAKEVIQCRCSLVFRNK